jgi:hypothetical protein
MQSHSVSAGEQVQTGQQIGTVGTLGNGSGCHLHFEVHARGGRIYEDPVDPVRPTVPVSDDGATTRTGTLTVLSYNIEHANGGLERASAYRLQGAATSA